MNSKYKIMKYHGFNPFKSSQSYQLSSLISKDNNQLQKLKGRSKLSIKQIALILQGQEDIMKAKETNKNQQHEGMVTQNYEFHQYSESQGANHKKSIVMFNEREFCKKTFDQVFSSERLNKKSHQFYERILSFENQQNIKQKGRLIIYLANSAQKSQKVILGHNQTQSNSQNTNHSQSILQAIYQTMLQEKTQNDQKQSSIYFSAIGIEKENNLFDLLNQEHIHNDGSLTAVKIPQVKIRKISKDHDSVIAENLIKQPLKDKNHLNELIEKTKQVRNFIEFYDNFNQTFFLGQLYHFYQANSDYDLFNECVVLKINQHLPKISSQTINEGFYERRFLESNASRIATLTMRIGLNIKACRKNKMQGQTSNQFPKKMSQVQMHESKILLYMGPLFMNLSTHYVLINQVGGSSTIGDQIKKFELNRGFRPDKYAGNIKLASFYHTKHYLDAPQVQQIVGKLAITSLINNENKKKNQFSQSINYPNSRFSKNQGRPRKSLQIQVKQQNQANEQDKFIEIMQNKKFSHTLTNRTFQTESKRRKSMFRDGERVKSKSFFTQTISSSERNYWKQLERKRKKGQTLIDIRKLAHDDQIGSDSKIIKSLKTINSKTNGFGFVDDSNIVRKSLEGVRVTYKRKLVVKALPKTNAVYVME